MLATTFFHSFFLVSFCSSLSPFSTYRSIPANAPVGLEDVWGGPGIWDKLYPQASGNTGTCTTQGFFLYLGQCASVLFTGSIAISFLLQVKYQFREKQMRLTEKVLFGVSTLLLNNTTKTIHFPLTYNTSKTRFYQKTTDCFFLYCGEMYLIYSLYNH